MLPAVVARHIIERVYKFCIEYPVYKVVLIAEMVVKALAVHIAAFADVAYAYLCERAALHKLFQPLGKRALCNV